MDAGDPAALIPATCRLTGYSPIITASKETPGWRTIIASWHRPPRMIRVRVRVRTAH